MPSPTWATAAAAAEAQAPRGFHLFEVVGYSRAKDIPTGIAIQSSPFMIGGYRWVIEIYPNGKFPEDADFMSFSFTLIQDVTRPVKVHALFTFVDQLEWQDPRVVRTSPVTHVPSKVYIGSPRYITREAFERSEHLKNDCFTLPGDLIIVEDEWASRLEQANAD